MASPVFPLDSGVDHILDVRFFANVSEYPVPFTSFRLVDGHIPFEVLDRALELMTEPSGLLSSTAWLACLGRPRWPTP